MGMILHEIGHALGLWHEHQRTDRDDYVTIDYDNLEYWSASSNYNKNDVNDHQLPYDYNSVMHYSSTVSTTTYQL